MKNLKITSIILIICIVAVMIAPVASAAAEPPEIGAVSALLVERNTGEVFFSHHADERIFPASLTKMMTMLLVVEAIEDGRASLYDKVTAGDYAVELNTSELSIEEGEVMSLENLIYCAMLMSSNRACNILAEYIGGSVPEFVDAMNARAAELGCEGTNFVNTHGLQEEEHYSTVEDLAKIASEAMSHDLFVEVCNTVTYSIPATNKSEARKLTTTNHLLNKNTPYEGYYYADASGIKTGSTSAAGSCLASTASRGGIDLMCIVTGCEIRRSGQRILAMGSFEDTIALYDWVFDNYSFQNVLTTGESIAEVPVEMGSGTDSVALIPAGSISVLLPNNTDISAFSRDIVIHCEESGIGLIAPIDAGTVLGQMTVSNGDKVYGTVDLVAEKSVDLSKAQYMKGQIDRTWDNNVVRLVFWCLVILAVVYILLVVRYRLLNIRYVAAVKRVNASAAAEIAETDEKNPGEEKPMAFEEVFKADEPAARKKRFGFKKAAAAVKYEENVSCTAENEENTDESEESVIAASDSAASENADEHTRILMRVPATDEKSDEGNRAAESAFVNAAEKNAETEDEKAAREQAERDYFEEFFRRH